MGRTLLITPQSACKPPKCLKSRYVIPRGLKSCRNSIRTKLKAFLKRKRAENRNIHWLHQADLFKNLGLSLIKNRARKGILAVAGAGATEPRVLFEQLKKSASKASCSSLFIDGQFEQKTAQQQQYTPLDQNRNGTKEGLQKQRSLAAWAQDGQIFQQFDVDDDCYIVDVNTTKSTPRFIKIEKRDQEDIELPPEENPNMKEINELQKNNYNGQSTYIQKKTANQDELPVNDDPIDLTVAEKEGGYAGHVELPEPDPRFHARSINQICKKTSIVWRDKLNINFQMDSVTLLDTIAKFFEQIISFEKDPETGQMMSKEEQFSVRLLVDRALGWLITQIAFENIEPIRLTLLSSGDHKDVIEALSDPRNIQDVQVLIRQAKSPDAQKDELQQLFLTPHFLQQFDFSSSDDRLWLRAKLKFVSALLGFQCRIYMNKMKKNQHYVQARCMVGSLSWHRKKEQIGKKYPKFKRCNFLVQYMRNFNYTTKEKDNFKLVKFDFTHSHPLTLEYEMDYILAEAEAFSLINRSDNRFASKPINLETHDLTTNNDQDVIELN